MNSKNIAVELNMNHHSIVKLIKSNYDDFNKLGQLEVLSKENKNKKGGRPEICYDLNKFQYVFLITLLKNTNKGKKIKINLIKKILIE